MSISIEKKHDAAGRLIYARTGICIPLVAPMVEFPYYCNNCATLQVYCRTTEEIMRKYLDRTPFDFVSADYILSISDMTNVTSTFGGMMDVAVIVPVRYKEHVGGHYLIEFENNDITCILGREMWGYPKLLADATLDEKDGRIVARAFRGGEEFMHLELDMSRPMQKELPEFKIYPHLQAHTIPDVDGASIFLQRILTRDTSGDFQLTRRATGFGSAWIKDSGIIPMSGLMPREIYGAVYTVGDFAATEENGASTVIDTII